MNQNGEEMGRNRDQSLSASTPFGFSVPGLVCAVRKTSWHTGHFYFQEEALFHLLLIWSTLLQMMKALLLDFASRWLSGFILCQAFAPDMLDTRGKTKASTSSHTWEAHCQGPQTQQRLWCGQRAERHPGVISRPPSPPHLVPYSPPAAVEDYSNFDPDASSFAFFLIVFQLILERRFWVETCFLCHLQKFTTLLFFPVWSTGVVRCERLSQETALVLLLQHVCRSWRALEDHLALLMLC